MEDSIHVSAVVMNAKLPLDESCHLGAAAEAGRHAECSRHIQKEPAQQGQIAC
jgi:hypothetical protein